MLEKELTAVQRSVLLVLMAEGREVPNAVLTNQFKLKLDSKYRDDLKKRGLITVRIERARVYLTLDNGWEWCVEQFSAAEVPPGSGHGSAAAYALLGSIQRYTQSKGVSLSDFFLRMESEEATPVDLAGPIREAYDQLSDRGQQVKLADLRAHLKGLDEDEVSHALVELSLRSDVHIYPESRQALLTDADRRAAVRIGNQANHLIVID